jgi:hypothetical protein
LLEPFKALLDLAVENHFLFTPIFNINLFFPIVLLKSTPGDSLWRKVVMLIDAWLIVCMRGLPLLRVRATESLQIVLPLISDALIDVGLQLKLNRGSTILLAAIGLYPQVWKVGHVFLEPTILLKSPRVHVQ